MVMSKWNTSKDNRRKGLETGCREDFLGGFAIKGSRGIGQKGKGFKESRDFFFFFSFNCFTKHICVVIRTT